jgi:dihydropteroate synthase
MPVVIAGVLNLTPDSFSDGGRFASVESAAAAGLAMALAGADWIDVGGESTRPRAAPVSEGEEIRRVVPVIERLASKLGTRARISIDTYKAGTARAALAAGASLVNDVSGGLLEPAILEVAARAKAGVVVGHLRGDPATMMENIHFDDVVAEVTAELGLRIAAARTSGCTEIWADPGIGFGKTLDHNLTLLAHLPSLRDRLGVPLMVGVSRKRFIGDLTGRPVADRVFGTAAAVTAAILGGVAVVRVHDVQEISDVVKVAEAISSARFASYNGEPNG